MELLSVARDVETIEAGRWVEDIPGMGGLRLRVRGFSSKQYQAALSRLIRKSPREDREADGSFKLDSMQRVQGEAMADTLLLEWENLTRSGEAVPYSREMAKQLLTDPKFALFADAVVYAARVVDNERAEATEDLAKN